MQKHQPAARQSTHSRYICNHTEWCLFGDVWFGWRKPITHNIWLWCFGATRNLFKIIINNYNIVVHDDNENVEWLGIRCWMPEVLSHTQNNGNEISSCKLIDGIVCIRRSAKWHLMEMRKISAKSSDEVIIGFVRRRWMHVFDFNPNDRIRCLNYTKCSIDCYLIYFYIFAIVDFTYGKQPLVIQH